MKKSIVIAAVFISLLMGIDSGHSRKVGHQLINMEQALNESLANKEFADQALEIEREFKDCAKLCRG